jgi:hypothetical protein
MKRIEGSGWLVLFFCFIGISDKAKRSVGMRCFFIENEKGLKK